MFDKHNFNTKKKEKEKSIQLNKLYRPSLSILKDADKQTNFSNHLEESSSVPY